MKTAAQKKENPILACPVCLSDRLDHISVRMSKCLSCGFIWNHQVSDRDNLLLIVEHKDKWEAEQDTPAFRVFRSRKVRRAKKTRSSKG
jgi:hypothetical protein